VIFRKISFGTRSAQGSHCHFVDEVVLTGQDDGQVSNSGRMNPSKIACA